jgi:hypothetical protein
MGAGCDLPPSPSRPHLYTMADLEALAKAGKPLTIADDAGVPGGLAVSNIVQYDGAQYHLALRTLWTESYRSAYETTEVWTGFEEVWAQPVYVAVTGFNDDGSPKLLTDPTNANPNEQGWAPVFSVGPESAFYSPFWQTFYFVVPEGTDIESYTTARKVVDSGLPLIPGPAHTMSLVPTEAKPGELAPATTGAAGQAVGGPAQGTRRGYLDGNDVSYLDFGKDNFSWNDELVVEETPLFVLVYRDNAGSLQGLHVPPVGGTGPLYADRPPAIDGEGVPHYGAYWRLYTVEAPSSARIFAPEMVFGEDAVHQFQDTPYVGKDYGADVNLSTPAVVGKYFGRMALNALPAADMSTKGCFSSIAALDTCQWLDSQSALEHAVPPASIWRTDTTVTCPFVSYADKAIVVDP